MSYKVVLPVFEGPFDLLVYLIENARMSIYDIEISEITEQYIEFVRGMQNVNYARASEFMVLAATLLKIKSEMILPRSVKVDETEYEEDPRSELVERLIEYRKFKTAATFLGDRREMNSLIYDKPKEDISIYTDEPDEYLSLNLEQFTKAFELFMQKKLKEDQIREHYVRVEKDRTTMESRIAYIGSRLREAKATGIERISFYSLVPDITDPYDVVVSFVSVLQMMRDKTCEAVQESLYGEIMVIPCGERVY